MGGSGDLEIENREICNLEIEKSVAGIGKF
jgi:hypothetical protein